MTGRTSQNACAREPRMAGGRRRRTLLSLVAVLVFLATLLTAVAWFPESELGRTIGAHLAQLADPETWTQ